MLDGSDQPCVDVASPLALLTQRDPESVALVSADGCLITYAVLAATVKAFSSRMSKLGIHDGCPIVTALGHGPLAAAATLSAIASGTCCPVRSDFRAPELRRLFLRVRPSVLLVEEGVSSAAVAVAAEMGVATLYLAGGDKDLTASRITSDGRLPQASSRTALRGSSLLLQTSGTTGVEKLVPISWPTISAAARATATAYELTQRDRRLNVSHLAHVQGIVGCLLAALVSGGSVVLAPAFTSGGVPASVPAMLDKHGVTWFSATPAQHADILATACRMPFDSLRFVRVGASILSPSLKKQLEDFYQVPIIEGYGMTEASQIASTPLPPSVPREGLVPTGSEVAIRSGEGGVSREPGRRGELLVRGSNVASRYMGSATGYTSLCEHGWLRTGDEGEFLPDGSFRITGRLKDLINRRGSMISPVEVEEALMTHAAVADAGAFGLPHAVLGEQLAVAVVLKAGETVSCASIRDFLRALLSPTKLPDQVVFCDRLPRTWNGKVSRAALARQCDLIARAGSAHARSCADPARR